jgi:hypothetical protein
VPTRDAHAVLTEERAGVDESWRAAVAVGGEVLAQHAADDLAGDHDAALVHSRAPFEENSRGVVAVDAGVLHGERPRHRGRRPRVAGGDLGDAYARLGGIAPASRCAEGVGGLGGDHVGDAVLGDCALGVAVDHARLDDDAVAVECDAGEVDGENPAGSAVDRHEVARPSSRFAGVVAISPPVALVRRAWMRTRSAPMPLSVRSLAIVSALEPIAPEPSA